MPLSPQLNSSIPSQKFEIIRDRIGEILAVELANQWALNNAYPKVQKVWIERFIPFDSTLEFPAVNVNLEKGDYENVTQRRAPGTYIYNIDVYTNAAATSNEDGSINWGDSAALLQMSKIAGMIRTILSSPAYQTLAFDGGFIAQKMVLRFVVATKDKIRDSLSSVIGRLQLMVIAGEDAQLQTSVPLQLANTTIKLDESDQGFYIQAIPG